MEKYETSIEIEVEEPIIPEPVPFEEEEALEERPKAQSKGKAKKRGKRRLGFYFINVLLGAFIMALGIFIAAIFLFTLENIEYEGVKNSNAREINTALFSDKYSNNTLYAFGINLLRKNPSIAFVDRVDVYLKNPHTLVVSVKEDELSGYIKLNEVTNVYFNSQGTVTEVSKKLIDNVPIIQGVVLSEAIEGEPLNLTEGSRSSMVNLLKYLREVLITPDSVIFDRDGTYGFTTGGIFVDLGIAGDVREKCARLPYIMPSLEGQAGTLHLEEWDRSNSDIIFERYTADTAITDPAKEAADGEETPENTEVPTVDAAPDTEPDVEPEGE